MATLKLTSDTLAVTPAGGEIEYNGQFFGVDSNNSRAQFERITLATSQTASGTSVDFTGIPAWVKRITVMFNGVSLSGTSSILVQLGTSGGVESSGYASSSTGTTSTAGGTLNSTAGLIIRMAAAANATSGHMLLTNIQSNSWVSSHCLTADASTALTGGGGNKSLSATLDRVRITTANGTDTFDAGTINILYEG